MNNQVLKCKVEMLPTESKSTIVKDSLFKLYYDPDKNFNKSSRSNKYQHLYIISDREIKDGDIIMRAFDNAILRDNVNSDNRRGEKFYKIEATTDPELFRIKANHNDFDSKISLPSISKEFIQKYVKSYNEGKVITDVLLEIEKGKYHTGVVDCGDPDLWDSGYSDPDIIKTRDDNSVIIHPIKDSYTRDEVYEILEGALQHIYKRSRDVNASNDSIKEWFNKNY